MPTQKPVCQTVLPCLAPLTGQDSKALAVVVQSIALYSSCDAEAETNALIAFRSAVRCMQPSTRHLAYHAIAHCLDWGDREKIWARAGLETIKAGRCACE